MIRKNKRTIRNYKEKIGNTQKNTKSILGHSFPAFSLPSHEVNKTGDKQEIE